MLRPEGQGGGAGASPENVAPDAADLARANLAERGALVADLAPIAEGFEALLER